MKYLFKQDRLYYFRRKIPKTTKNFTFALNTKNVKIAQSIVGLFLHKAEPTFQIIKNQNKVDIMDNLTQILLLMNEYRTQALVEYSQMEEERHKQFSCTSKKGKLRDGGHPKCIKKWLKILQDSVYTLESKETKKYFDEIFNRTGIDRNLYNKLSAEHKRNIQFEIIKSEAHILQTDYDRAEQRFGTENIAQALQQKQPQNQVQEPSNQFYKKKAREIADDFIKIKERDTKEIHKYKGPIDIFFNVINKKYLIDFEAKDMEDFVYIMKNIPPNRTKDDRNLYLKYKDDYWQLVQFVSDNNIHTVSLKTAIEKIKKVTSFLDYAVEVESLDKNRLDSKYIMPSATERAKAKENEEKTRLPLTDEQLNLLFTENKWYTDKLSHNLRHEQDRFYIPLIGLLQGFRLNEAAQLYISDIIEVNKVICFRIDKINPNQKLKTKSSKRTIPIHPKLIELGFLKYIEYLKKDNQTRVFPQLYLTKNKGYGQAFSKKFNNKDFKSQWIDQSILDDPKILTDFHSLRHSFATKLSGRIEDSQLSFLMGHENKSENQKRYTVPDPRVLLESIKKLDIEGIDFSNIQNVANDII